MQKAVKCAEENGKHRHAMATTEGAGRIGDMPIQYKAPDKSSERPPLQFGFVCWPTRRVTSAAKLRAPISDLSKDLSPGQPFALPISKIRKLQRQFRKRRRPVGRKCLINREQLSREDLIDRDAVNNALVCCHHQPRF